mmetsp:Transcript_10349/g.18295  ORF Transcript_10349/g.18295 Transcript_10349/m.18295 type:complete len:87 (-) Transcript_10349:582-842(-)
MTGALPVTCCYDFLHRTARVRRCTTCACQQMCTPAARITCLMRRCCKDGPERPPPYCPVGVLSPPSLKLARHAAAPSRSAVEAFHL